MTIFSSVWMTRTVSRSTTAVRAATEFSASTSPRSHKKAFYA